MMMILEYGSVWHELLRPMMIILEPAAKELHCAMIGVTTWDMVLKNIRMLSKQHALEDEMVHLSISSVFVVS